MQVVDFHTHFFSRPFFEALAALSTQPGTPDERLARLAESTGIELPSRDVGEHLARWIRILDAAGVAHMVTFASAPEEVPAVAEAAQRSEGRLSAMAICNPLAPGAAERIDGLLSSGVYRGVLMFPAMHHYSPADPRCAPLFEVLANHRAVAFVHCGLLVVKLRDLLGLPRRYDLRYANPLDVIPAADAHPEATFCIPHFGGGFFRETLLAAAQCRNVVTDTSSTNSWIRTQPNNPTLRDVFERALDVLGPERVLFGTDSNTLPAGWRKERLEAQLAICEDLGLTSDERELVFGGAAHRILSRFRAAP